MGREISYCAGGRQQTDEQHQEHHKPPEMKFILHRIGKERQPVTYQTAKDYIIQLVQNSFRIEKM
jgi:hypothetical protein